MVGTIARVALVLPLVIYTDTAPVGINATSPFAASTIGSGVVVVPLIGCSVVLLLIYP